MAVHHCDTWHQLEAADERSWLDAWARNQQALPTEAADYHPVIIRQSDTEACSVSPGDNSVQPAG